MEPSIAGALICCGLFAVAWWVSEVPVVVALVASLAFGSTAIVTLSALGGSSPMIYVVFLFALLASVALRRDFMRQLGTVLAEQPVAWIILILIAYTVVGAILLPRMFEGEATVFVPAREQKRIAEVPLVPVAGNITQALYFVLSALAFFAMSILLKRRGALKALRFGFFGWALLNIGMAFLDLFGKAAGLGDILAPIRSATYAMLTEAEVAGFFRIAGGYSEASAFGATTVVLLAFTFTYWRSTRDRFAFALTVVLLALVILSTSSTAYGALGVLGLALGISIARAALQDRLQAQDLLVIAGGIVVIGLAVGVFLHNNNALDPLWHLFDTMVLDKSSSESAQERAYWNLKSLESLYDTGGLGIGLGSSRASSWVIAVLSQFGIIGSLMIGYLTVLIVRGRKLRQSRELDLETRATILSMTSASIAALVSSSISGGGADPGIIFFLTLAVVATYRRGAIEGYRPAPAAAPSWASSGALSGRRLA
jgi:hypothetical protein